MSDGDSLGCFAAVVVVAIAGVWGWSALKDRQVAGDLLLGRDCPFGSERAGDHPPRGTEEWCQKVGDSGDVVRFGLYRRWDTGGQLLVEGAYVDGRPSGNWRVRQNPAHLFKTVPAPRAKDAADPDLTWAIGARLPAPFPQDAVAQVDTKTKLVVKVSHESECHDAKRLGVSCWKQPSVICEAIVDGRCWETVEACEAATTRGCGVVSVEQLWDRQDELARAAEHDFAVRIR